MLPTHYALLLAEGPSQRALVPSPPTERGSGGFIADGYDAALDELRATSGDARRAIAAMEARYRDETGIASLKIRHNGVLGYFIEVGARHADALMAPDSGFTHRQTMAGAVRFNSLKLHEEAARIAEAGGHALAAEEAHFEELVAEVVGARHAIAAHTARESRAQSVTWLGTQAYSPVTAPSQRPKTNCTNNAQPFVEMCI